jgi:anti-anti-sigma factor
VRRFTALILRPERVVLDLSQLTFMDSTGIHAAVELRQLAAHHNAQLEIIQASRAVQQLFALCHLTDVLPFRSDA